MGDEQRFSLDGKNVSSRLASAIPLMLASKGVANSRFEP
jgi:hypothetical protein